MLRTLVILFSVGTLAMGQAVVQHAAAAAGGAAAAAGSKKVAEGLDAILSKAAGPAAPTVPAAPAVPAAPPKPAPQTTAQAPVKRGKHSPFDSQVTQTQGSSVPQQAVAPPHIPSPAEVEASSGMATGELAPGNLWAPRRASGASSPVTPFSPGLSMEGGPIMVRATRNSNPPQLADSSQAPAPEIMAIVPVVPPPPPPVTATAEKFAAIQAGFASASVVEQLGPPAVKLAMYEEGKLLETWRIEIHGVRVGTIRLVDGVVSMVEPAVN